jgi:predicted nucleic acid-binding protein
MNGQPVADSTVLIYLARISHLDLLDELFGDVLVPDAVYEESVEQGRQAGYRDARSIDACFEHGLQRYELEDELAAEADELKRTAELGPGEAAAIVLARALDQRCLTDDHAARTTAEAVGLEVGGTIFVLLLGLEREVLTLDDYQGAIDALTEEGFRMSASLYRHARAAGERVEG